MEAVRRGSHWSPLDATKSQILLAHLWLKPGIWSGLDLYGTVPEFVLPKMLLGAGWICYGAQALWADSYFSTLIGSKLPSSYIWKNLAQAWMFVLGSESENKMVLYSAI